MRRTNRTSTKQYWYIPLHLPISITRNGRKEQLVMNIRISRPSLQWILFFLGMATLARTAVQNGHIDDPLVPWVYAGCIPAAAIIAKVVVKLATREITPRGLTGLLGMVGFGYSTTSLSTGEDALLPLAAAGAVVLLTVFGEAGYRIYQRYSPDSQQLDEGFAAEDPAVAPIEPEAAPLPTVAEMPTTSKGRSTNRSRQRRRPSGKGGKAGKGSAKAA